MANKEIYKKAKQKKVFLWKVAERLDKTDSAFSKMLRKELPDKDKKNILKIIEEIAVTQKEEPELGDD